MSYRSSHPGPAVQHRASGAPWQRAMRYYRRNVARHIFQRRALVRPSQPLISFTFDDFPRTALLQGGALLERYGLRGTFYVALGLLGGNSPSGPICVADDLPELVQRGHELACHTYAHCHSWDTSSAVFEASIVQNREALRSLLPAAEFRSFAYPISEPQPLSKRAAARHFLSCRAGGQSFNAGSSDLNQLAGFFLEKCQGRMEPIEDVIGRNRAERGWLIFATHDISAEPSPYGCTPGFFEQVVRSALESGARIVPVCDAVAELMQG
jgi:peptidoglycan/xylan/chitin deacetylase (PgdA/CDA1 family)